MTDLFLTSAGVLGMVIALVHGWLGSTKVVAPVEGIPAYAKRILYALMLVSAVYWFVGGAALAAAPWMMDAGQLRLTVIIVSAMYLSGAAANCWATRGKHFGWMLLTLASALALAGGFLPS